MTTPRAKRKTRPAGDFLYREIAGHIRSDIRGGRYRPGTRLPSLDQLALEHKANRLTVLRALNSLKLSGFVYSVPAQGIYVSDAVPDTDEPVRPKSGFKIGLVSQVMMHGRIGAYHADIISGKEFGRETAVHSLDTYQEDNAFMRSIWQSQN